MARERRLGLASQGWGHVLFVLLAILKKWNSASARSKARDSVTGITASQWMKVGTLIGLGLGLGLYDAGEVFAILVISGALILLPALALLSGLLVWHGGKGFVALVASWKWTQPVRPPAVLAGLGNN